MKSVRCCVLCISLIAICYGHGKYKQFIPNGRRVPDPCVEGATGVWKWVGHVTVDPRPQKNAQQLNAFGQDFKNIKNRLTANIDWKKLIWPELCLLDSDGDGLTNGQELGDTNCTWRYGNGIPDIAPLTHPGIPQNGNGTLTAETNLRFCKPTSPK